MADKTFTAPLELNENIKFGLLSKRLPTEGNLAWEYNPFRNYRITEPKYYFRGKFFSKEELELELDPTGATKIPEDNSVKDWENFKYPALKNGIQPYEDDPVFYDKNQLIDFDTEELEFDINHPVDILPQYSYDGSVNLIINDGKNPPRLINSRFSPLGREKYQIVDRRGDNDTNIYDEGSQFESDTSLYKTYVGIPKLDFINVFSGGNMSVGNYHFYFKYVDADGNETDFVAESGMVSIFKGSTYGSIHSGFRHESAYKSVRFILSNIDPAYQYVNVYYTKCTSDINQDQVVSAYKIDQKFLVNNALVCQIHITGNEPITEITVDEINTLYQIADNVQTQASCQNMLFFGNITDQNINYREFADLSLRFMARPDTSKSYSPVPHDYNNVVSNTYSDPKFIYNYTGYQNHEIYRFGVVYLMSNGSLSPVFNIRGMFFTENTQEYTNIPIYNNDSRNYIAYDDTTGIIYKSTEGQEENEENNKLQSLESLENVYGIVRIESGLYSEIDNVVGIKIEINDKERLFKELAKYKIKGYFFVRQKRIPLRLCQGLSVGVDGESNTPLLYTDNSTTINSKSKDKVKNDNNFFITERFLSDNRELVHNLEDRLYCVKSSDVNKYGIICPDYDINSPYFNSLFCGDEYLIEQLTDSTPLLQDRVNSRHFYIDDPKYLENKNYPNSRSLFYTRIVGVEDNTKLIEVGNKLFSARAGEAEEAFRFEYINQELKFTETNNLLRGSYGPYLATDTYNSPGTLVNIYIKDYLTMSNEDLFKIRIHDKSPYYAISNRYDITEVPNEGPILYRGDTYICTFTHRFNRNFQDPSAPTNHKIVDEACWKDNFEVSDGVVDLEKFEKINLGDVNAIKLGLWITFPVVSSSNLNIRALDESNVDETTLTGHPRGFYPYYGMSADGSYKTPEALCFNKGFGVSLSQRHNFEAPEAPAIKNDFTNRIAYSDINITDAFKNGFRTFKSTHYRDYPKTYGQITKIVELRGNLMCIFEHGIALIAVNERAVAGEGAGGNIYITTSNVLPQNPKIISDTFGSQWKDSIVKTPLGIYGVDTVGKKIWRTNGDTFECISDFRVQEFLNKNITLSERELQPVIGVRNIKTHYNKFKRDVMFTFYDNLYGFEEKVWNLCYNELMGKWITFYSWVPSYSENIYNQYFSFDRNTSKWITKLGISKTGNSFSDGVTLSKNIIPNNTKKEQLVGILNLANRTLPQGDNIEIIKSYELVRDNFRNWEKFEIKPIVKGHSITINQKDPSQYVVIALNPKNPKGLYKYQSGKLVKVTNENEKLDVDNWGLYLKVPAVDLCSEFYERRIENEIIYSDNVKSEANIENWKTEIVLQSKGKIYKDERGRRKWLKQENQINGSTPVYLLNIKCNIEVKDNNSIPTLAEAYNNNLSSVDAGYYQSVVAVMPQYNMQFLTTDFWKHGQAGIIDITDKIYPTYWYGKRHPFEFEFIVADNPHLHKIFDNLEIISNNAEPESFHYEIIGDCYEFAKDKKNMYIRQEATKELYQYNGSDILFDSDYVKLDSVHRKRYIIQNGSKIELDGYDKSTLFPLYYCRKDDFNNIEDYYHLKDGTSQSKDFSALSGAEIVKYDTLQEYRIWNHAKAVDMLDDTKGRLRGNMQYKEDKWYVQINPINLVQKNEEEWRDLNGEKTDKIPVELNQNPLPSDVLGGKFDVPSSFEKRGYVQWNWEDSQNKEVKLKDKWVKIRIRYSGDKLAIITAIKTLYSASYA